MLDKIKIGWKEYSIKFTEDRVYMEICSNNEAFGVIDYDNQEIEITTRYGEDTSKCALIHEALHGIDEMHQLGLTEERVIAISNALYTVLKDNDLIIVKK